MLSVSVTATPEFHGFAEAAEMDSNAATAASKLFVNMLFIRYNLHSGLK